MKKLAVLISGSGTNMQSIVDACRVGSINADVVLVISSNHSAKGILRAQEYQIDNYVCALSDFESRESRDVRILQLLDDYKIDFVVLAGYLGIFSEALVDKYANRIINIHPSLLPKYGGKDFHGMNVHNAVIAAGESESGATVHFVDKSIDTGKIIRQRRVEVKAGDTPEDLQKRILPVEHELIVEVLSDLCG